MSTGCSQPTLSTENKLLSKQGQLHTAEASRAGENSNALLASAPPRFSPHTQQEGPRS